MSVATSRIGFVMMAGGVAELVLGRAVVSTSPVVIFAQVLAIALMIWARLAFGRRSFHATATPTEGGIVTAGPYGFIRHPETVQDMERQFSEAVEKAGRKVTAVLHAKTVRATAPHEWQAVLDAKIT